GQYGFDLLEMRAPVDAFQKYPINFVAQGWDIADNFDPPFFPQLGGELLETVSAGVDVATTALKCRDNPRSWDVSGITAIIEGFRKGNHVRSVEANNSQAKWLLALAKNRAP